MLFLSAGVTIRRTRCLSEGSDTLCNLSLGNYSITVKIACASLEMVLMRLSRMSLESPLMLTKLTVVLVK